MYVVTMNSHEEGCAPAVWGPFNTEGAARSWARANESSLARSSWDDAGSIAIFAVKAPSGGLCVQCGEAADQS